MRTEVEPHPFQSLCLVVAAGLAMTLQKSTSRIVGVGEGIGSALQDVLHHIHGLQKERWYSCGTDLNATECNIAIDLMTC
eukprot:s29_g14.t1